jgi:ketosteroid isomerase-like protein
MHISMLIEKSLNTSDDSVMNKGVVNIAGAQKRGGNHRWTVRATYCLHTQFDG